MAEFIWDAAFQNFTWATRPAPAGTGERPRSAARPMPLRLSQSIARIRPAERRLSPDGRKQNCWESNPYRLGDAEELHAPINNNGPVVRSALSVPVPPVTYDRCSGSKHACE